VRIDGGGGAAVSLGGKSGGAKAGAKVRAPLDTVMNFTRQLQVMLGAAIPLVQALEILADQQSHAGFRAAIVEIRNRVQAGAYLWESFAGFPYLFPKIYVSLIRAGEASGSLENVLKRLARYLEDASRLRKLLVSAMVYPIAVIAVAVLVISIMLVVVIPKFEEMLRGTNQELPELTRLVIGLSRFVVSNAGLIFGGGFIAVFLLVRFFQTEEGRATRDRILFRVPLFGELMRKAGVARFSRTMTVLLGAGVNLVDGIDICRATIDNAVLEGAVSKIRSEVEAGKTLGSSLAGQPVFPKMAVQMISVGESSGALDKMLERVADFYEVEVETMISGMTKLIEPLLLVVLGGSVAILMVAMYLPLFKMAGAAGGG
jgi:type IV pilus assembly protein PilC